MKTKFDIGDHVLIQFEVENITIDSNGKINYLLTADYQPYDDVIKVEEKAIEKFMEKDCNHKEPLMPGCPDDEL